MKSPLFPFTKIIHVGVVSGHFFLVAVLGLSFWGLHQTVNNFELVSHSGRITSGLVQLFVDLHDAEDHQQVFLLSGKPDSLNAYRVEVKNIQNGISRLQEITASGNSRGTRLQEFYTMIQEHLNLLQNVLDQYAAQSPQSVREGIIKGIGMNVMNEIRNFMVTMSRENSTYLQNLDEAAHEMESLTIKAIILGMALTLVTGLITLWKLRQDLFDRQHLQRRVMEEAKLAEFSRLIGDISHDIKNMLTPVQMGLSLLEDELNDYFRHPSTTDRENRQKIQTVYTELISMARRGSGRIQERMKEIAEAVKGRSTPPLFAACQLSKIVGNVFEALRLYAGEQGVTLHQERLDSLPNIRADQKRLFNAFYNLVNNAIAEVPAGGSITIRGELGPDNQQIILQVKDTGRGMTREVQESLFTAKVLSCKAGGTGLGTKIVKDVVDAHGGTIQVESQEGLGTTFTICLPKGGPVISAA